MKNKKTIAIATAAMSLTTVVPAFAAEKVVAPAHGTEVKMNIVNQRAQRIVKPENLDQVMIELKNKGLNPEIVGQDKKVAPSGQETTTAYIVSFDSAKETADISNHKSKIIAIENYLKSIKDDKRYKITQETIEYSISENGTEILPSKTVVTVEDTLAANGFEKTEYTFLNVDTNFKVTEDAVVTTKAIDMKEEGAHKELSKVIYKLKKEKAAKNLKITKKVNSDETQMRVYIYDKNEVPVGHLNILNFDQLKENKIVEIPVDNDFKGHWAEDAIVEAMLNGDVTVADKFRANEQITRAEFASMIQRTFKDIIPLKDDNPNFKPEFTDVSKGDWFAAPIVALTEAGLINGYGDGTFRPNEIIKRQEAAVILASIDKGADAKGKYHPVDITTKDKDGKVVHHDTITQFADDKQIPVWADEAVQYLVNKKVVSGYNDNTFKAANSITRAESVLMAQNVKAK